MIPVLGTAGCDWLRRYSSTGNLWAAVDLDLDTADDGDMQHAHGTRDTVGDRYLRTPYSGALRAFAACIGIWDGPFPPSCSSQIIYTHKNAIVYMGRERPRCSPNNNDLVFVLIVILLKSE